MHFLAHCIPVSASFAVVEASQAPKERVAPSDTSDDSDGEGASTAPRQTTAKRKAAWATDSCELTWLVGDACCVGYSWQVF